MAMISVAPARHLLVDPFEKSPTAGSVALRLKMDFHRWCFGFLVDLQDRRGGGWVLGESARQERRGGTFLDCSLKGM